MTIDSILSSASLRTLKMTCMRGVGVFVACFLLISTARASTIDQVLQGYLSHPLFSESEVGVQVVNLKTMEEVFSHRADEHFIPASVMKAVTAAVALQELGPEYEFVTEVRYTGEINKDGVLKGNLYVIGSGDPYMDGEGIWKLIRDMKLVGVSAIQGNIYFDDSRFNGASYIPGWGKEVDLANGPSYFPVRSALNFNTNNIAIRVTPGSLVGTSAKIQLEYPFSLVEIDNQVKTGAASKPSWMTIEREVKYVDPEISITQGEIHPVQKIIYHVNGRIPVNTTEPWIYYRSILQPEVFFQENFMLILQEQGIGHRGKVEFKKSPDVTYALTRYASDPVRMLIADMNKHSRNLTAEMLLLELGTLQGLPGTTEKGLSFVEDYLVQLGVWDPKKTVIHNGSGLSPMMQMRPSQVTAVMLDMYTNTSIGPEYYVSMAVAGRDGTLKRRLTEEPYIATARGKTGSINGVYCVATYIQSFDGTPYVMVFFANELKRPSNHVRDLQNQMIQAVVDFKAE